MCPIIPVSSARVSDTLIRERLLRQIQYDQYQLFKIQTQLSTGQRIDFDIGDGHRRSA